MYYLKLSLNSSTFNRKCLLHLRRFLLGDRFIVVKRIWPGSGGLPLDDGDLHVLDLDADQQEVDLTNDHVFQVIPNHKQPQ